MSFISPVFFLFFPAVLLLDRLTPGKYRWAILLLASYFFYAYYNVWLLTLIFLTTVVSYLCGLRIQSAKTQRQRRMAVALDIAVCLGILFLFKYLDFTLGGIFALSRLLGAEISFSGFHLLLPMGISFYVFQTLSYTLDVYRGDVPAERHLGYYALFVVFFPQLVAGPIERPGALLPQLKQNRALGPGDVPEGLRLLLRGYAKKVLISDYLARFVDAAYQNTATAGGAALLLATVLFAIQIYCDFSGYSDIALGYARLMGIRLSENFRRPYSAASIRDFWRRWHISLTRWLTDYLYIPLGGSRRGLPRQCFNILVVFLASGLWHGANVTFLIWGGLHGLYLVVEILILRDREIASSPGKALHRAITLLLICFAWIFFRAPSLPDAMCTIRAIFTDFQLSNVLAGLSMSRAELLPLCLMVALVPMLERLPAIPTPRTESRRQWATMLLYFLLITAVFLCRFLVLSQHGATSFIYFQF